MAPLRSPMRQWLLRGWAPCSTAAGPPGAARPSGGCRGDIAAAAAWNRANRNAVPPGPTGQGPGTPQDGPSPNQRRGEKRGSPPAPSGVG